MDTHSNNQFYYTLYYLKEFSDNNIQTVTELEQYMIYMCSAIIYAHQANGRIVFEKFNNKDELIIGYYDAYIKSGDKVIRDLLSTDGYFNASVMYPNLPPIQELQKMSELCILVNDIHIPWIYEQRMI